MGKPYRNNIMASIHETAEDLYEAGLMEKCTMREFDGLCLTPISPLKPEDDFHRVQKSGSSKSIFNTKTA